MKFFPQNICLFSDDNIVVNLISRSIRTNAVHPGRACRQAPTEVCLYISLLSAPERPEERQLRSQLEMTAEFLLEARI